jgi:penicillin amidase
MFSQMRRLAALTRLIVAIARRSGELPAPNSVALAQRLAAIPSRGLPLGRPVAIYWNDNQVPFIEAESDRDLATALGVVHAHLRLAQIELLRRVSRGRLAELLGPVAVDLDHLLRILDFGRAVPAMAAALSSETRLWLEGFVAGINHYLSAVRELPHEFAAFGIAREPWRIEDVLTIARLAATDVTWLIWFRLMALRSRPGWTELSDRLRGSEITPGGGTDLVDLALQPATRSGSNAVAVSGARSKSGAAVVAGDPHLSIILPNLWLVAGFRSPSYHAVGLMIPGLPFIALGRNRAIAWGGTNLHAGSSELYDVSTLPAHAIRNRSETIAVRWQHPRTVTIRETDFGPIVTDAALLRARGGGAAALRWIGHQPSHEITAMLRMNRAESWEDFGSALDGFAIPGQNMLYGDVSGRIGQLMAAHLPQRSPGIRLEPIARDDQGTDWARIMTARTLPSVVDPPEGFLASANNRPNADHVVVGFFFSPDDRVRRLRELLRRRDAISFEDVAALQRDVRQQQALERRDWLLSLLEPRMRAPQRDARLRKLLAAFAAWSGEYRADSPGALAHELVFHQLANRLLTKERLAAYATVWRTRHLIAGDLSALPRAQVARALEQALAPAARDFQRFGTWGELHRVRVSHPLGALPLVGRRYRFVDIPGAGSAETLMKTAHPLTNKRHAASYGSNARYLVDLSDPDRSFFALLGGQDGWLGSSTATDQVAPWQRGEYVQVPMREATVRALFRHRTELTP